LSYCGEQLHSSSPNPEEKPLLLAENELLGAASSIEAASNKLSQMRPRQVHVKKIFFFKLLKIIRQNSATYLNILF